MWTSFFEQDVGYEYLGGLLLRAEYSGQFCVVHESGSNSVFASVRIHLCSVPSREIFDALFCMLFEMEDWASDDSDRVYIIKNQGHQQLHECVNKNIPVACFHTTFRRAKLDVPVAASLPN